MLNQLHNISHFIVVYSDFIVPNNMSEDTDFLKYEFTDLLLRAVGIDQEYAFSDSLTSKYWHEEQIGNLTAMTAGACDVSIRPFPVLYNL